MVVDPGSQRETAEAALVDLQNAQAAAAAAAQRAEDARVETDAPTGAIDEARRRLDEFVVLTYQQGLDSGPLGLLTGVYRLARTARPLTWRVAG